MQKHASSARKHSCFCGQDGRRSFVGCCEDLGGTSASVNIEDPRIIKDSDGILPQVFVATPRRVIEEPTVQCAPRVGGWVHCKCCLHPEPMTLEDAVLVFIVPGLRAADWDSRICVDTCHRTSGEVHFANIWHIYVVASGIVCAS